MKKGKKKHGDGDNDGDNDDNGDNGDNDNGDNGDNDNNDNDNEGEEVGEGREGPKRAKTGKRAAKAARCVPAPHFLIDSNVFDRKKALDRMREDTLASAAPLPKKLPRYVPPPPFF